MSTLRGLPGGGDLHEGQNHWQILEGFSKKKPHFLNSDAWLLYHSEPWSLFLICLLRQWPLRATDGLVFSLGASQDPKHCFRLCLLGVCHCSGMQTGWKSYLCILSRRNPGFREETWWGRDEAAMRGWGRLGASSVWLLVPPSFPGDTAAQTFKWLVLWSNGQICSSSSMLNQFIPHARQSVSRRAHLNPANPKVESDLVDATPNGPHSPRKLLSLRGSRAFLHQGPAWAFPVWGDMGGCRQSGWVNLKLILLTWEINWLQAPGKWQHRH